MFSLVKALYDYDGTFKMGGNIVLLIGMSPRELYYHQFIIDYNSSDGLIPEDS